MPDIDTIAISVSIACALAIVAIVVIIVTANRERVHPLVKVQALLSTAANYCAMPKKKPLKKLADTLEKALNLLAHVAETEERPLAVPRDNLSKAYAVANAQLETGDIRDSYMRTIAENIETTRDYITKYFGISRQVDKKYYKRYNKQLRKDQARFFLDSLGGNAPDIFDTVDPFDSTQPPTNSEQETAKKSKDDSEQKTANKSASKNADIDPFGFPTTDNATAKKSKDDNEQKGANPKGKKQKQRVIDPFDLDSTDDKK